MKRWVIFLLILILPAINFAQSKTQRTATTNQMAILQSQLQFYKQQDDSLSIQLQSLRAEKQMWMMLDAKQKQIIDALRQQLKSSASTTLVDSWLGEEGAIFYKGVDELKRVVSQYPWLQGVMQVSDIRVFIAPTVVILVLLLVWLLWTFRAKKNAKPLHHGSTEKRSTSYHYLAGDDVIASKLDLARSYIDMGDKDNARDILLSVLQEGDKKQQAEAKELLKRV